MCVVATNVVNSSGTRVGVCIEHSLNQNTMSTMLISCWNKICVGHYSEQAYTSPRVKLF